MKKANTTLNLNRKKMKQKEVKSLYSRSHSKIGLQETVQVCTSSRFWIQDKETCLTGKFNLLNLIYSDQRRNYKLIAEEN